VSFLRYYPGLTAWATIVSRLSVLRFRFRLELASHGIVLKHPLLQLIQQIQRLERRQVVEVGFFQPIHDLL
jgi:hypothetical protein